MGAFVSGPTSGVSGGVATGGLPANCPDVGGSEAAGVIGVTGVAESTIDFVGAGTVLMEESDAAAKEASLMLDCNVEFREIAFKPVRIAACSSACLSGSSFKPSSS